MDLFCYLGITLVSFLLKAMLEKVSQLVGLLAIAGVP